MPRCLLPLLLATVAAAADPLPVNVVVSTADGRGADATVSKSGTHGTKADIGVRVNQYDTHWQQAWLRFDLAAARKNPANPPKGGKVRAVQLELTIATKDPVHLGAWTFNVFGLVERHDYGQAVLGADWNEAAIDWSNAPGNHPHGGGGTYDKGRPNSGGVRSDMVEFLGTFSIQPKPAGTVIAFSSRELTNFVAADSDQLVTLIITRETAAVNAVSFAAKEHGQLDPPRLGFIMR